ncbi:hypothetical protein [Pseudoflavonifractor phocaeensis]|uniref:hypothetical protein n=1 Tax=Pseudoflavonifractor phocaeensis TaxID=1870988 RepID=UPI00210EC869|nr:hypothetical protein [Pseudoflavonifractor phocaeensis]MCQ4866575.1 hypothetical protein [Pseudoflavonifractor phocaeensis]
MTRVGIWGRDRGVFEAVRNALGDRGPRVKLLPGAHPADFAEGKLDLLCVTPEATGWAGLSAVNCRVLLLPGTAGPLARGLRCVSAVSYGTSPRDTLTFSSLEGDQICLALQREIVDVDGGVVEQQEFVLPFPPGLPPAGYLAAAGVLLLLGVEPGKLADGTKEAK